jgi:hypothetical protein
VFFNKIAESIGLRVGLKKITVWKREKICFARKVLKAEGQFYQTLIICVKSNFQTSKPNQTDAMHDVRAGEHVNRM